MCNSFIRAGKYKKIILLAGDKMSSITDYTDRTTCPLFGDAVGAVMIEPTEEELGILDVELHSDGIGYEPLQMKAGGSKYPASYETVERRSTRYNKMSGGIQAPYHVWRRCRSTS